MAVLENNQMQVTTNIVDPPKETLTIYPVKDAYIDQENPVFSFGTTSDLLIRGSSTKADKAILSFQIPVFDQLVLDNMVSAELQFTFVEYLWRDTEMTLKLIEDDGWSETGTTWAGQPLEHTETYQTVTVKAGTSKFKYDVLPLIKELNGSSGTLAFSLSESNGDQDTYIHVGARERSTAASRPQINVVYEYFPDNYEIADLKGNVIVRRSTNAQLKANLSVIGGTKNADIPCSLTVNGYTGEDNGINVSLSVAAIKVSDLESTLTVQRYANANLPAKNFGVALYNDNADLAITDFKVIQYYEDIPSSLTIKQYRGTADLHVDFAIKKDTTKDLKASVIIRGRKDKAQLPCTFAVKKSVDYIPKKTSIDESTEISQEIKGLIKEASLPVTGLTVPLYGDNADITSSITVRPNGMGEITVSDFSVKGYHENADGIIAALKVKPHADITVNDFSVLKLAVAELKADMVTRPSWAKDLPTTLQVVKDPKKPYAFIM